MSLSADLPAEARALAAGCAAAGLDLAHDFNTAWYDACVPPLHRLPRLSAWEEGRGRLGVLIGNSAALWAPFVAAFEADPTLQAASDPLDVWVERVVLGALAAAPPVAVAWGRMGASPLVSLTQLAAVSGAGWAAPSHLTVHPEHGPWVAWRAAVVFDHPPPPGDPRWVAAPCGACAQRCAPAAASALARGAWGLGWLPARDACPHGQASRYAPAQLLYHYTHDRRWIRGA